MSLGGDLGGELIISSISAGVSLFSVDGVTGAELINAADVAVKVSQCHGARMAVEYRKDFEHQYMPGYSLAQTHKIISGCFAVYQPIVDCRNNDVYYYEALIRHDSVSTSDIVRAAAHYKLWPEVFDVIIRCVVDVCKLTSKPISINVVPSQIYDAELLLEGLMYAKENGVAPSRIILEITENEPIIDPDAFMRNLRILSNMGVKISLDDFGAGFSFFNRLASGGIDHVKIDRGIISGMLLRKDKHALIKAMKFYCDELNISLIVEGVELDEEVEFLASMGITLMQGYAFSQPLNLCELKGFCIGKY